MVLWEKLLRAVLSHVELRIFRGLKPKAWNSRRKTKIFFRTASPFVSILHAGRISIGIGATKNDVSRSDAPSFGEKVKLCYRLTLIFDGVAVFSAFF